ncbi:MAG: hypothetical protein N3A54_04210 [Patescibacteria group bacterium]|nr:hypothetical protein [Patescibacteria group bacterium]
MDYIISLILIGLGIRPPSLPPSVLGDEHTAVANVQNVQQIDKNTTIQKTESLKTIREEAKKNKEDIRANIEVKKNEIQEERELVNEERKTRAEEIKKEIQAKREQAKEEFKEQREAFKKRLDSIRDERKKQIVENVDIRLSEINTQRTSQMSDRIARMEEVIQKLNQKILLLEEEGKNVFSAKSALSQAQVSLSVAKTAVSSQAAKEYVIGITGETRLKEDVKKSMEAMKKDLEDTQETIKRAREAIVSAVKAVALAQGGS